MKVSVLKCQDYNVKLIEDTIRKSLKLINFEIPKNKTILLKPNVLGQNKPKTATDTNPAIIDAICNIFKDNKIWIGDSSGISDYGGTKRAFEVCGIADVAKKHDARIISFEASERKEIIDPEAKILKKFILAKEPFKADLVINVPKLKTHILMKFTGAVKNMFGTVPGGGKSKGHALAPNEDDFGNLLLDIYKNVKPDLNIMDAITGLEGDGPGTAGKPKHLGLILTSKDAVALDIAASEIVGYNPMDIKTISFAIERNLFPSLYSAETVGEKNLKITIKKPLAKSKFVSKVPKFIKKIVFNISSIKPYVNKANCKRCNICANVCPVKAIQLKPYPEFDRNKCVLCYCCHEHCPHNAIVLRKSGLNKALDLAKKILRRE